jgi:Transposase
VCLRVPGPRGGRRQQIKTFATTGSLLRLPDWLVEQRVTVVGREATGDSWKPVYYVLDDLVEAQLPNAAHMRNVPGRNTDVSDSAWIAQLTEHGLVRASFVPLRPIRRLRDLTRYRAALPPSGPGEKRRLEKLLEDAGIKLSVFVFDIFGVSGPAMLSALVDGEHRPCGRGCLSARPDAAEGPHAGAGADWPRASTSPAALARATGGCVPGWARQPRRRPPQRTPTAGLSTIGSRAARQEARAHCRRARSAGRCLARHQRRRKLPRSRRAALPHPGGPSSADPPTVTQLQQLGYQVQISPAPGSVSHKPGVGRGRR